MLRKTVRYKKLTMRIASGESHTFIVKVEAWWLFGVIPLVFIESIAKGSF